MLARGSSGRDQLPQGSRFWIVLRDFEGRDLSPPLVFNHFSGAKELVKRGASLGNSVCIGLPARSDVESVFASGGLGIPEFR